MDKSAHGEPAPAAGAVLAAFGLRGPVRSMTPVAGAWSNRVWRLSTVSGCYAVKQLLNPFGETRWRERLDAAFTFELAAQSLGVAMPRPVPTTDGDCVADVAATDGSTVPVRVHRWVDGRPMDREPVELPVAAWVGRTLARLHRLDVRPPDRSVFPSLHTSSVDGWSTLVADASAAGAPWVAELAAVQPLVGRVAALVRRARTDRQVERMAHGDIDQKNMLMTRGSPVLCDFDVAHPMQRRSELADVALSMGCWQSPVVGRAVLSSYSGARGPASTTLRPTDLARSLVSALDWLTLCARRSLEDPLAGDDVAGLCRRLRLKIEAANRLADLTPVPMVTMLRR